MVPETVVVPVAMTLTVPPACPAWAAEASILPDTFISVPRAVTVPPEPSAFVDETVPETFVVPPAVSQTWPLIVCVPVAETRPPLFPAIA